MECSKCKKDKELAFEKLCKKCFCDIIESRMKKAFHLLEIRGSNLLFIGDTSERIFNSLFDIKPNFKTLSLDFFNSKDLFELMQNSNFYDYLKNEKIDFAILPWTADHEASSLLESFFTNNSNIKNAMTLMETKKIVLFFREITNHELELYCKLKNIDFKAEFMPKSHAFATDFEKSYAGTIHSLAKSNIILNNALTENTKVNLDENK